MKKDISIHFFLNILSKIPIKVRNKITITIGILVFMSFSFNYYGQTSPYPKSDYISGITYNWATYIKLAPGSDNWTTTWADDDNQYAVWGDGGGFGGTNTIGRVSLGVARIEGSKSAYTGYNVWGGYNQEHPANVDGKSRGIICINGVLYMWVGPGSVPVGFNESRLYTSTDHGATWVKNNSWAFVKSEGIIMPGFLQFGKNFANARDNYSYIYASRYVSDTSQIPGKIDLMRVNKTQILNRASYEFFKGIDLSGNPVWTSDLTLRQPVFEDANGVGRGLGVSVIYNPGLDRYILIVEHSSFAQGNIGVFEAPEPWGPWKIVVYESGFGAGKIEQSAFYWNISPKWLSSGGKDFVMIFTGVNSLDSWNTVEASLTVNLLPVELSEFNCRIIDKSVTLNWITATEINNYGFEIERKSISPDTKENNWTKLGFVNGHGNSNSPKSYSFIDKNIYGGTKFKYRLKQIDNDGKYELSKEVEIELIPEAYFLFQNYPNPFNPTTNFKFQIVSYGLVLLKVYDVLGNEIATVINKEFDPGLYNYQWDAGYLSSGVYFYRLQAGEFISTKKLLLIK